MSKTKAGGSTKLGRDSISKRLGIKLYAGEFARPGAILIRQRGTKFLPGKNVARGEDDTLFAVSGGTVRFRTVRKKRFDGRSKFTNIVSVEEK